MYQPLLRENRINNSIYNSIYLKYFTITLFITMTFITIFLISYILIMSHNNYQECITITKVYNITFDCNEFSKKIYCYDNLYKDPNNYTNQTYICH